MRSTRMTTPLRVVSVAVAGAVLLTVGALPAVADQEHVDLSVVIPADLGPGEFTWRAPQSVNLGEAVVGPAGDRLRASSDQLRVEVSDTRHGQPAWAIDGIATQFTTVAGDDFTSAYLGWTPEVTVPGAGAVAGPPVPSGFDQLELVANAEQGGLRAGLGLDTKRLLAQRGAPQESATGVVTGSLILEVPRGTTPGAYSAVLQLEATLGG